MKSPLMRILDAMVKLDAHDTRKVIDMADAHLRDLEECKVCHGEVGHRVNCPEGIAFDHREGAEFQRRVEGLRQPACTRCGEEGHSVREHDFVEGAELQAGLEAAVVRERERLDGPDCTICGGRGCFVCKGTGKSVDGPDDEEQCPACEDEGHVGQTDAF